MKLYSTIVDDFFEEKTFIAIREFAENSKYEGKESPYDGVVYPDLAETVPEELQIDIYEKISEAIGVHLINPKAIFIRLSKDGVQAPHQARRDLVAQDQGLWQPH